MNRRPFIAALIAAMRPKQWTKNLLLFAGLLFTLDKHHGIGDLITASQGFFVFSLLSSATYLVNDVLDIATDRHHPRKKFRPIAAGEIKPTFAIAFAILLGLASLMWAFHLGLRFGICSTTYLVITTAYTLRLKHVVIMDLLLLASGFVLRAIAGAWVLHVPISPWLVLCTLLLALFLGISKRRGELVAVRRGRHGRPILSEYSDEMLTQMSTIVTSALLMSYCLYTIESDAARNHNYLLATIPFVVYGIFRYLYLIHKHDLGESPDEVLLKDRPILASVVLWGLTTGLIILHPWQP
jgi:4-hydroxybenzoate polyprenyltransferase